MNPDSRRASLEGKHAGAVVLHIAARRQHADRDHRGAVAARPAAAALDQPARPIVLQGLTAELPIQLRTLTGLHEPLCALVYSYLSHSDLMALRDPAHPYRADLHLLARYLPGPEAGPVRLIQLPAEQLSVEDREAAHAFALRAQSEG